ncbi:unnamed protein product [Bursaphelenchus okinawaensis]|uniref:Rab-GAP TBC domain-containing protein n=1 Tax=Bursaphelenchus okinawaensis TaxID=465554 RepID=A0A811K4Z8_9BILA|nr:unnamed protein product [Bursaphelenchus okinawaensis]CAG9092613.1 unnamed protein product [Bursaphelenchus okinawaensis]
MPSALCAGSSLPLDAPKPRIPTSESSPRGLNTASKVLHMEALNRSFHNATSLASEIKESVNNVTKIDKIRPSSVNSKRNRESPIMHHSPTSIVRHFSIRFKNHVQTSLSDPLKKGSFRRKPRNVTPAQQSDENEGGASSSDELDDPEVLALFEREQIVDKYEKGPEQAGIDPWENPNFELYEKTDRFGFIHKEGLTKQEIERKEQIKERKRCLKWDAMYKEWEHREPTKMRERIWKGIPESYRIRAWSKMLHIEEYKNGNEKVYQELLVRGQLLSKEVKQIDLDVNRTYRDNVAFMKRYDISQKRLFQILTAYSMYNTEVGYCQGMNHIVALLIMYMSDDEDAFWGLHSLLANKKYTMHGFFVPSFPKLRKFEDHFLNRVLPKYAPKVHKHFEKLMLPPIYLPKWWFGCFLDRVPFKLVLRIWDVFLFLGDGVLMAMALNIFKMHEKKVIRMSMEQFMDFIQRGLPADFGYTDDQVMESLKRWLEKLQDDKMALPPRKEDDFPNQPLGPVLKRSLVDIRMDIAEIHSRSSRANSLAGRSPAPLRSRRSQKPNEKASLSQSVTALPTPNAQAFKNTASESDPRPLRPSGTPPIDGFRRKPSVRNGRTAAPLPIPDADGFVPLSATKNRHSLYDNVTPSTTPSSGSRLPAHSRETSSDRVHRAANNVTYIQLTDDDRVPSPPPDYDTDDLR